MSGPSPSSSPSSREDPLNPELLTWSALLSQCVRLAQAAVALPEDAGEDGQRGRAWRASVSHVIRLQAVWFALSRGSEIPADQRALGRDRAGVAFSESGSALREIWLGAGVPMPEGIASLLADVDAAIEAFD